MSFSERDRTLVVHDNAVLKMPFDSPCKNGSFNIPPELTQFRNVVPVIHRDDVLLDDRAHVELGGDVVSGSTNSFDTSFVRLTVRIGTHECREKRMVNVDDSIRESVDEITRKNLHVARQHDQVGVTVQESEGMLLRVGLRFR